MLLVRAAIVFGAAVVILAAFGNSSCSFVSDIHGASEVSPRKLWVNNVGQKSVKDKHDTMDVDVRNDMCIVYESNSSFDL
jgi:hypothetical protein